MNQTITKVQKTMQNTLDVDKITLFCNIQPLYTITNLCAVLENIFGKFSYSFKSWPTKKSGIRETPTLLPCADSSTNFMKSHPFDTFLHLWALFSQLFAFFGTFCDFFSLKKN